MVRVNREYLKARKPSRSPRGLAVNQMRVPNLFGVVNCRTCRVHVLTLTAVCTASASTILVDASRSSHDRGEDPRIGPVLRRCGSYGTNPSTIVHDARRYYLRDRTTRRGARRSPAAGVPSRYQRSPPTSPVTRWRVRVPDGKVSPRVPRALFDRLIPSNVLGLAERCCWRLLDGYGAI